MKQYLYLVVRDIWLIKRKAKEKTSGLCGNLTKQKEGYYTWFARNLAIFKILLNFYWHKYRYSQHRPEKKDKKIINFRKHRFVQVEKLRVSIFF